MIKREIFCKPDNGSQSQWQKWRGAVTDGIKDDYLYSCGEIYIQSKLIEGEWVFRYRPHFDSLVFPDWINKPMDQFQAVLALDLFADWVMENRRELVAQLESYEA